MKFDILTLVFIQSILFFIQVIALFIQYRVNKTYRGIGWWVVGSFLMAIGVIFMPMVVVKSLLIFARIANPCVVLGQIFLYIGILKFLDKKANKWTLVTIFLVFIFLYYYYMLFNNDISSRTIILNVTLATISMITACKLFLKKDKLMSVSANFTASVFLIYGCFLIIRALFALLLPHMNTYSDQEAILIIGFIVPIITSTLWTFGFIIMHNQRLNIENLMEKDKMQKIFNTIPDAALITRLTDGLLIDVNEGFLAMTGYTYNEVIGESTLKINLWSNIEERNVFITELKKEGICENMEFVFIRKNGIQFVGIISGRMIKIYDVPHLVSSIHDITERKQAEESLMESEEKYRSILNASPDDITITDLGGRIVMVSPAAKKMFGYETNNEGLIGKRLVDFIVPEEVERAWVNIQLMNKVGDRKEMEYHAVRKNSDIFDIEVNSEFIRNSKGQPIKMVFIIRDITERKRAEQKIQELIRQLEIERNTAQQNSITDSLTGVANRRYFDEALRTEFFRLKRSGDVLTLIMIDVDYFKRYNDNYGHLAGDDCLRQITTKLKSIVGRESDIVARYGGEEFCVVLPKTEENGAQTIAEHIRKAVEELAIPHATSSIGKYVTVSVGVVTVDTTGLETPEQVVTLADEALYRAKKGGRNRIEVETNNTKTGKDIQ